MRRDYLGNVALGYVDLLGLSEYRVDRLLVVLELLLLGDGRPDDVGRAQPVVRAPQGPLHVQVIRALPR